jgi:hypothetical protein
LSALAYDFRQKQEPMYSVVNSKLEKITTEGKDYFYFASYNLGFTCEYSSELLWIPDKGLYMDLSNPKKCYQQGSNRSGQNLIDEKAFVNMELLALKLEDTQIAIIKPMFEQVPNDYKTLKNAVLGSPGATDGGAYWLKFRSKGIDKSFFIDADLSVRDGKYSPEVVNYNQILIKGISDLYDSEMKNLK